ncbi:unnamed protein product, partial [marine sediment metagenome]
MRILIRDNKARQWKFAKSVTAKTLIRRLCGPKDIYAKYRNIKE